MTEYKKLTPEDDFELAEIIRYNLKSHGLAIPGTVYFDSNLNHLSEYYDESNKRLYDLLVEDGRILGGIGLAEFEGFESCAELQKLYLIDDAKGRGLGKKLITHIIEKARELGYNKLYLETHTNLDVAINLYKKMGFEDIEKPATVCHSGMNTFMLRDL